MSLDCILSFVRFIGVQKQEIAGEKYYKKRCMKIRYSKDRERNGPH
jgi:hypothetical protein